MGKHPSSSQPILTNSLRTQMSGRQNSNLHPFWSPTLMAETCHFPCIICTSTRSLSGFTSTVFLGEYILLCFCVMFTFLNTFQCLDKISWILFSGFKKVCPEARGMSALCEFNNKQTDLAKRKMICCSLEVLLGAQL